jgi:hypothetical protein
LKEEECEFVNDANLQHALEISSQRAVTEEAGCRLMEAGDRNSQSSTLIATTRRSPASRRGTPRSKLLGEGWKRKDSAAGKPLRRWPPCSTAACAMFDVILYQANGNHVAF